MSAEYDIALTMDTHGKVVMHRADCPVARLYADLGEPVMTLFGCQGLPTDVQRHSCLEEEGEKDAR